MPIQRQDVIDRLAACEAQELRLILEAAGKAPRGAESPRQLAERVTNALWWAYCTPAGYASGQVSLDQMVSRTARRLKVRDRVHGEDAWERLATLTEALAANALEDGAAVSFDDLRADHQARARGSVLPSLAWGGTSVTSYGAGAAGRLFLQFAGTPIGKILPWIPQVRPWFGAIKKASSVAAIVGTPLSVALAVVAVNQGLSTRWRTVLPLLLSVGALGAGSRVSDVEVVG